MAWDGVADTKLLTPGLDDPVWGASLGPSRTMLLEAGVQLHFSSHDAALAKAASIATP